MDEKTFIDLILISNQKIDGDIQASLLAIIDFISKQESISFLLSIIIRPELRNQENPLLIKACLIYLHQAIVIHLSSNFTIDLLDKFFEVFNTYQNDTNFEVIYSLYQSLKLFFPHFAGNEQILNILLDNLNGLLRREKTYQAILFANLIIKFFEQYYNPSYIDILLFVASKIFNIFPVGFFDNIESNLNLVNPFLILILKSVNIFNFVYSIQMNDTSPDYYCSSRFIPMNFLTRILPLGGYPNVTYLKKYTSFWRFISKSLNGFYNAFDDLQRNAIPEDQIPILFQENQNCFNQKAISCFSKLYIKQSISIFKSKDYNEYIKSIPIRFLSLFAKRLSLNDVLNLISFEMVLTMHDARHNLDQFDNIRTYASVFKEALTSFDDKIFIYQNVTRKIYPQMCEKCNTRQGYKVPIKITFLNYLSIAIKKIPSIVFHDTEFLTQYMLESLQSKYPPMMYAGLKCFYHLFNDTENSFDVIAHLSDFISQIIPSVLKLILSEIKPLSDICFYIYSKYIGLTNSIDIDFIIRNQEAIKEISTQFYFCFISNYIMICPECDQEFIRNFLNESLSLIKGSLLSVPDEDIINIFPIFTSITLLLTQNDQYFDMTFDMLYNQYGQYVNEFIPKLVNFETNEVNINLLKEKHIYTFRLGASICKIAYIYCSNFYLNRPQQKEFLMQCLTAVWKVVPFLMRSGSEMGNMANQRNYEKEFSVMIENVGQSLALMPSDQLLYFTHSISEGFLNTNDFFMYTLNLVLFKDIFPILVHLINGENYNFIKSQIEIFINSYFEIIIKCTNKEDTSLLYSVTLTEPLIDELIKFKDDPLFPYQNEILKFACEQTHSFLLNRLDTSNVKEINPYHRIPPNLITFYNDIIESIISVPNLDMNVFWTNIYIEACQSFSEDLLYCASDTFIKAVTKQSLSADLQNSISFFIVNIYASHLQGAYPLKITQMQNIVFLFNVLIRYNSNQIVLEFLRVKINDLIQDSNSFHSDDDLQYSCLLDNVGSLYLALGKFFADLDPQLMLSFIDRFIPKDQSENANFLSSFLFYINPANQSPYFSLINMKIFSKLIFLFSSSFGYLLEMKIPNDIYQQTVGLFIQIYLGGLPQSTQFVNHEIGNDQLRLERFNTFISFYSPKPPP